MNTSRRIAAVCGSAIGAVALALAPAVAGVAADQGAPGFIRVAHLSPDTTAVDLTLTALAGNTVVYQQGGIGYGAVSDYLPLSPGTYAIAMVPAGEPADSTPVLSGELEVASGAAATVAGIGPNAELETLVIEDDFTPAADGAARVRVVQASALSDTVDVSSSDDTVLAAGAALGDVGEYTDVPAGALELALVAGDVQDDASVDLAAGSVHTLFVVDEADGSLTVMPALDGARVDAPPLGGVETGGGALAWSDRQQQMVTTAGVGVIGLVALVGLGFALRRGARSRA